MPIYKKYNQQQLDLQYNNRFHVPDFETYLKRWESLSREVEIKHHFIKNLAYGNLPRERLDVFPSPKPHSKTLVFIHGGYWQLFDKSSFYFIAAAFARYDITTVLLNYPLSPADSMDQIVASCRKAISWLKDNLAELGGDPDQIYVAGHSAGAHLATMLIAGDNPENNAVSLKGICAISGIYNLIPIQLSKINNVLKMDKVMVNRNSPAFFTPFISCLSLITVGALETEEFKDQSKELYHNWQNKTKSKHIELEGLNHFSILDSLYHTDSLLHKALCKLMEV
jgi:arylformamidase